MALFLLGVSDTCWMEHRIMIVFLEARLILREPVTEKNRKVHMVPFYKAHEKLFEFSKCSFEV